MLQLENQMQAKLILEHLKYTLSRRVYKYIIDQQTEKIEDFYKNNANCSTIS